MKYKIHDRSLAQAKRDREAQAKEQEIKSAELIDAEVTCNEQSKIISANLVKIDCRANMQTYSACLMHTQL